MPLSLIENAVNKLLNTPVPNLERVCLPLVTDNDVTRKVDILKAEIHEINLKGFNSSQSIYPLIVNGDQLWQIQCKDDKIQVDVFNAYTLKLTKTKSLDIFLSSTLNPLIKAYETSNNTVWIVLLSTSNEKYFSAVEISTKTFEIKSVDFSNEAELMFMSSLVFFNTRFQQAHEWEDEFLFSTENWTSNNKFVQFYCQEILHDYNAFQVKKLVSEQNFTSTTFNSFFINNYFVNKDTIILSVQDRSELIWKAVISVFHDGYYRHFRIKDFYKFQYCWIAFRGDGAILLFDYILNKTDILC